MVHLLSINQYRMAHQHMTVRETIKNMAGSGTYPGPGGVQASLLPGAGDITLSLECDVLIAYLPASPPVPDVRVRFHPTWPRTVTR